VGRERLRWDRQGKEASDEMSGTREKKVIQGEDNRGQSIRLNEVRGGGHAEGKKQPTGLECEGK